MVPLRPRAADPATAFSAGDYDSLLAAAQLPAALRTLAAVAHRHAASFSLDATAAGKLRIFLHEPEQPRDIVLEWWTQVELRDARDRLAAIPAAAILARVQGRLLPPELELLLWLAHLRHRRKL